MIADIMKKVIARQDLTDDERNELVAWFERAEPAPSLLETMFKGASRITSAAQITDGVMGIMVAGKFIALAPGVLTVLPTDTGFTGTFVSGSGETFGSTVYNIGGVAAGVLQWGASQTTGKLIMAAGNIFGDTDGFFLRNVSGVIYFGNAADDGTWPMSLYGNASDYIQLQNDTAGKGIAMVIALSDATTPQVVWEEDANNAAVANLLINEGATPTHISISGNVASNTGVEIWANKDGKETVFNDTSYDIDHRFEGATDANLVKMDGGTDRVGIGVAAPTVKLDVNGTINIATGNTYKINGTDVLSATQTGRTDEQLQDITGAMFTGNTETGITATYQDSDGTIDLEVTPAGVGAIPNNGWVEVTDSWTYASASTITIPSDGTATYSRWMKIRFKQGGNYKFYICTALTATLITVLVNDDYVVANSAITDVAYSFAENPYQFPRHFKYSPVWTNLTLGNGTDESTVTIHNGQVFFQVNILWGTTTSIGGSVTVTLPVAAAANYAQITPIGIARYKDATGGNAASGIVFSTGVLAVLNSSGTYALGDPLSSTVPFTWTTSDILALQCNYFAD